MARMEQLLVALQSIPDSDLIEFTSNPERMQDIQNRLYKLIEGNNVRTESGRFGKSELEKLFNVSTEYEIQGKSRLKITEDRNTPASLVRVFLSYYASRLETTPEKNRGELKKAVFCLGKGGYSEENGNRKYDNGNIEFISGLFSSNNIEHHIQNPTSAPIRKTEPDAQPVTDRQSRIAKKTQASDVLPKEQKQQIKKQAGTSAVYSQPTPAVPISTNQGAQPRANKDDKPLLPLRSISVLDCVEIEPKRYLVEGLIEAGSITQYAGKEKGGKTYTLMCMGLCMSAGIPWLDRKTMADVQGSVLWLNLDMSRALGKRRVNEIANGIEEAFDVRNPHMFDNFHLMDSQSFSEANRDGLEFFTDNNAVQGLQEFIIANNTVCCFLDNLIQVEGKAQENVSNDMRTVLNRIKTLRDITDCAFIFIHHTDKAGNRGRGSSDIFAETDLNLQLEPDTKDPNLLKLVIDGARSIASKDIGMYQEWKQRIGDDGQPMTDANGYPVYLYTLRSADASIITTAKEERSSSGRVNKTISDNIEKIKDVFRNNGNVPLSKNKIIQNGSLSGTKDTRIASIDQALSENILKSETGLLFVLNNDII